MARTRAAARSPVRSPNRTLCISSELVQSIQYTDIDLYFAPNGENKNNNFQHSVFDRLVLPQPSMIAPVWGFKRVNKRFIESVEAGRAWLLFKAPRNGNYVSLAWVDAVTPRVLGPLVPLTETNKERGWTDGEWNFDITFKMIWDTRLWTCLTHERFIHINKVVRTLFPFDQRLHPQDYEEIVQDIKTLTSHIKPNWHI
jgi:hypothetical protein